MSVASAPVDQPSTALVPVPSPIERQVEYVPLGETEKIKLSIGMVKQWLVKPTRSGAMPTDADVMQFIMMCKARELNPWVGDAYCVGYDSKDGPVFNLITSVQALFKRADAHPEYDGIESGVIVKTKDGEIDDRKGDFFAEGEVLLGGWARVYRSDRSRPFEERIKLATFNKNRSVWNTDPEGMISKCAESAALRKAFPTQLGGLYLREEMDAHRTIEGTATEVKPKVEQEMDSLAAGLEGKRKGISQSAPVVDMNAQLEAAKAAREAQITANAEPPENELAQAQLSEPEGSSVVDDFRKQIDALDDESNAKVLAMTIRKSKAISENERTILQRAVNEKLHFIISQMA